jgi:biopolymer transport protein ExbD
MATYKRELRKEIKRRAIEPEINFLNITAMMDMMTIILVFLLKTMSASTANIPQSADLTMPKSTLTTEASQEGVVVVVSKTQILVDSSPVGVEIPKDATHGVEGRFKRNGPNDLYITKLGQALQSWREIDKQVRAATGKDASGSEAIVICDADTPYRLLVEVLFTLGQTEFSKFHLMVLQGAKKG